MGVDCKSIAKASKVRILHLPPRAQRAPDLRKRRSGALSFGPAVIGSHRLFTGVRGECVGKLRSRPGLRDHHGRFRSRRQRQRRLDACFRDLFLAIGALGVDPEEDIDTVPGPLGDLGLDAHSEAPSVQQGARPADRPAWLSRRSVFGQAASVLHHRSGSRDTSYSLCGPAACPLRNDNWGTTAPARRLPSVGVRKECSMGGGRTGCGYDWAGCRGCAGIRSARSSTVGVRTMRRPARRRES
jgi:hypothetical protein